MLGDVVSAMEVKEEKSVIVMDAGIATEENLAIIRSEKYGYDYVCVSRSIPMHYDKLTDKATAISDNSGHEIELTKVAVPGKYDCFLHVKSAQKKKKEDSIDKKLTDRLEAQLQDIKEREKPKGEYFLRYTKTAVSEDDVWQVYNLTRSVEAVFRCLKTDLDIRPIYHQKDDYIELHIWLGIIAYQVVNYIRTALNGHGITYSWATITEKMEAMQSSIVSVNNSRNEKIYVKLCTRPTRDQAATFDALGFKHRPFVRKTKVVPQL